MNDASPLTAGSTWGSAQSRSAAAPWQPPADPAAPAAAVLPFKLRSGFDRRRLNPSEYPSLEAAGRKSALVAQLALTKAPTSALLGPPSGLVSECGTHSARDGTTSPQRSASCMQC